MRLSSTAGLLTGMVKMTPDKDPFNYSALTYMWVILLSVWGGLANYIRKVRVGVTARFSFTELIGELVTSGLAGLITFWLCEAADTDPMISAALIAISGHMGARIIFHLENVIEHKFKGMGGSDD